MSAYFDISGRIGPLYKPIGEPEWPMLSYDRPAYLLWNAIGRELSRQGWTEEQIIEWLQSKETRWALDGELGDAIDNLGTEFAKSKHIAARDTV